MQNLKINNNAMAIKASSIKNVFWCETAKGSGAGAAQGCQDFRTYWAKSDLAAKSR